MTPARVTSRHQKASQQSLRPAESWIGLIHLGMDVRQTGAEESTRAPAASSAASLPLPRLPGHLIDGPSDDEKENEAKRPRSTSTTPKSGKRMDPDDYDRVMGINSADFFSEENRCGDGELTDTENPVEGIANNSGTSVDSHSGIGSCPGAAESSKGCGSASPAEIFNRLPMF